MARITKDLRNENRLHVYEYLADTQVTTRTEISKATGISGPTVLRIVDELIDLGIVKEGPMDSRNVGRPCVGLSFQADFACTVSIIHEGSWITGSLMDMSGRTLASKQENANEDFEFLVRKQVPNLINSLLEQTEISTRKLAAIGLGLPAILDPYENTIQYAPLINIDQPMRINEWLRELEQNYDAFVFIENDVNALAMGEHAARKLEDHMDMAYVALGTGIGAGLILRGELRRGKNNRAGEIGMSLTPDGKDLEDHIGLRALYATFGTVEKSKASMKEYIVQMLSPYLINFALGFDLDLIVLGGHTVTLLGEELVAAISKQVNYLSPMPIRVEACVSHQPGLEGLGQLLRSRFMKKLQEIGLDAIRKYL